MINIKQDYIVLQNEHEYLAITVKYCKFSIQI